MALAKERYGFKPNDECDSCAVKARRLRPSRGLRGIVRAKALKTAIQDASAICWRDIGELLLVTCQFRAPAPNMLRPFSDATIIPYRVTGQRRHRRLNVAGIKAPRCSALLKIHSLKVSVMLS